MRTTFSATLIAAALLTGAAGVAQAGTGSTTTDTCTVTVPEIIVLSAPNGGPVGAASAGDTFARRSVTGAWSYGVVYGQVNHTGWILSQYLEC